MKIFDYSSVALQTSNLPNTFILGHWTGKDALIFILYTLCPLATNKELEDAYNRGVGDGVDWREARRGDIKEGYLVAMEKLQTLRGRGCGPGLNEVPLGLSSNWNVWVELYSLPQSLGPGHQQELPVPLWNAQDEDRGGKGKQASQVWIFLLLTAEGRPPRRNMENPSKSQAWWINYSPPQFCVWHSLDYETLWKSFPTQVHLH